MTGRERLRAARQARGYSQQQLAGMAGVSRQAVSAVESGQSDPSLRVALALAGALGMTVEELFGPDEPGGSGPLLYARLVGPSAGERVTLAQVSGELVALPLTGAAVSRAGFRPAGGLLIAGDLDGPAVGEPAGQGGPARHEPVTAAVRAIGPPRPTVVVAGCDPALPLLEEPLSLLDPPFAFSWWPCSSEEALRLAAGGLVHAAGAHLLDRSGGYNTGPARDLLPGGGEVIGFSAWREGLAVAAGVSPHISGLADVVRHRLRIVNREPGAEARRVLDRELDRIGVRGDWVTGYRALATSHLEVASAIAAGLADAGVTSEPAALAFGLRFLPLASERFDLVIPGHQLGSREAQALLRVLTSRWLLDQLASLPGYDPEPCGIHVATLPAARPGGTPTMNAPAASAPAG